MNDALKMRTFHTKGRAWDPCDGWYDAGREVLQFSTDGGATWNDVEDVYDDKYYSVTKRNGIPFVSWKEQR